jgi:hypothetical protein
MAGDWIKMRVDIAKDPAVIAMADYLASQREFMDWLPGLVQQSSNASAHEHVTRYVTVAVTVSALLVFWGVANNVGKPDGDDLVMRHATLDTISASAGLPCFGHALASVDWAVEENRAGKRSVRLPKFLINNIPSEDRSRRTNAERQARYRERKALHGDVTRNATDDATANATVTGREEEKRRDVTASLSPAGAHEAGDTQRGDHPPAAPAAPPATVFGTLTPSQAAELVKACKALRKMGAPRFHPGDEQLVAMIADGFSAEQVVRCCGEKALRDAGLWNDPDTHPDLFDLLVNGDGQQAMGLTPAQFTAVRSAVAQVSAGYIASTLRGRRRDAAAGDNKPAARRRKPSATDNFEGKTYVGTPVDQLPPELRAAVEQQLG